MIRRFSGLLLCILLLAGCHARPPRTVTEPGVSPLDGIACVGRIEPPLDAVREVQDEELLKTAVAASGKGNLCIGRVYETTRPLTVYRGWTKEKSYTQFGRWWSMKKPSGNMESYRQLYAICPEWNALNIFSTCTVKVGTHIVIGPGQSADCDGGVTFGKSAANQVFIPNDAQHNLLFVEHCEPIAETPTPSK